MDFEIGDQVELREDMSHCDFEDVRGIIVDICYLERVAEVEWDDGSSDWISLEDLTIDDFDDYIGEWDWDVDDL